MFLIGLLLGTATGYSQDLSSSQTDSLRLVLNRPLPDSVRVDILFRLAESYIVKTGDDRRDLTYAADCLRKVELINAAVQSADIAAYQILIGSMLAKERKQDKQAKEMAWQAVNLLSNSKNQYYLGKAYFNLSDYYPYTDRTTLVEKIRLVELAVRCFGQSKYIEAHANSLKYLADLYEINEQRSKVLETLNLSLKLYESIHYPKLSGVYILYNRYYYLRGNYKLALDYCLMALRDAERVKDSSLSYCQINNYMAITLCHLKERQRAIGYYKTALRISEKYKNNSDVLLVMNNMVRNYIELKKPREALELMKSIPKELLVPTSEEGYILTSLCYASIYFALKEYPETGIHCNQILEQIKVHMPRAQVVNDFYQLLIGYYLESRQFSAAGIYLHKIDSLSRKLDDPARIRDNYYLAFRLDTATGSTRSAIANLLKFQHLHDSLFDETSSREMQQMEVEYETQKNKNEIKIKDQDIVLLNQKNELQQSGLQRADMARHFSIGGLGLLLVIIALLYRRFRDKQKSSNVISAKNEMLQRLVIEKEWLVKEVHHRVKNNLQMVISLLNTQSAFLDNGPAKLAIRDSQRRMYAMALIHQKLYQSEKVCMIDMQGYINELASYLKDIFNANADICFEQAVEPVSLNVSQAVPVGLILNEAITNSIKYAFSKNSEGLIRISLTVAADDQIHLEVADNGRGLPDNVNVLKSKSLGMNLITGLARQLEGTLHLKNDGGLRILITFPFNKNRTGHEEVDLEGIAEKQR
ncbi:MAG: histidine kinase dimerization/phosphoacceptor domain -containing protein [Chitinophagaceae bacterium]